jgi:hypothetical protein
VVNVEYCGKQQARWLAAYGLALTLIVYRLPLACSLR